MTARSALVAVLAPLVLVGSAAGLEAQLELRFKDPPAPPVRVAPELVAAQAISREAARFGVEAAQASRPVATDHGNGFLTVVANVRFDGLEKPLPVTVTLERTDYAVVSVDG